MSKIFGEFESGEGLNETALNLRESEENDEIIILGQENNIPEDDVKRFIEKEIDYLIKAKGEETVQGKAKIVQKEDKIVQKEDEIVQENETTTEKIKRQLEKSKVNSIPAAPIVEYLINKCNTDDIFSKRVLLKDKNLKDCFNYVYSEAKKKLKGANGWLHDAEVYKIAEDYFNIDNVKIENKILETQKNTKSNAAKTKVKKHDKKDILIQDRKTLKEGQVSIFDI